MVCALCEEVLDYKITAILKAWCARHRSKPSKQQSIPTFKQKPLSFQGNEHKIQNVASMKQGKLLFDIFILCVVAAYLLLLLQNTFTRMLSR